MIEIFNIVGYCRISVDEELDRDNVSIENQKSIIQDYVRQHFPNSNLTFYEDRDRSGYTFEQREGYQSMRPKLMRHEYDILIIKDFSRFSRRNSRGLVELEDLRDAGVRIISIGDSIDYPTYEDWTAIQFRFLVNEMPVTDTSKKIRAVVKNRQSKGEWLCAAPYGYIINKHKQFEIVPAEAEVVRKVFQLYIEGLGYKKIAERLTELNIPTPRMVEKERKEARGEICKLKINPIWSLVTIQEMLDNDFYIGTLRQRKYTRKKINGDDIELDESEHIIFEHHHQEIIDYRTFATVQALRQRRSTGHYRGVKKYDNVYSGFLKCGDCGSPMFSRSRPDLRSAYLCGSYFRHGLKYCTSHTMYVDTLDALVKSYISKIKENSANMIEHLNKDISKEQKDIGETENAVGNLEQTITNLREELKAIKRQRVKEVMKHPEREDMIDQTYDEIEDEIMNKIKGLENQVELTNDKRNTIIRINRTAKTALEVFDDILQKDKLERNDLELIIKQITVYKDHVEVQLQADIDSILNCGKLSEEQEITNFNLGMKDTENAVIVQKAFRRKDEVFHVNVISEGDPLEIFTNADGEVIFKKYSPIGEISSIASQYAEVLSKIGGCPAAICDRDHIIAVSGMQKKEILERRVSGSLEDLIEQRKSHVYRSTEDGRLMPIEGVNKYAIVCAPIISQGDVNGAVMMLDGEGAEYATPEQTALVQAAAMYFSKQMEE